MDTPPVLIVEDHLDTRQMCADFLAFYGFRVDQASDGIEALGKVERTAPAVVVLDMSLPKVDGWQVARRMKEDPRLKRPPSWP